MDRILFRGAYLYPGLFLACSSFPNLAMSRYQVLTGSDSARHRSAAIMEMILLLMFPSSAMIIGRTLDRYSMKQFLGRGTRSSCFRALRRFWCSAEAVGGK